MFKRLYGLENGFFRSVYMLSLWIGLLSMQSSHAKANREFKRILTARQALKILYQPRTTEPEGKALSLRSDTVSLLDARDLAPQFYWAHAEGAQHTPWRKFTESHRSGVIKDKSDLQELVRRLGLQPQKIVVVYGHWHKGWGEEARMLWLLEYLGHDQVYIVEGGWAALKAEGIPVDWGRANSPSPTTWSLNIDQSRRANTVRVEQLIREGTISFDARSWHEFKGSTPYGSAYGGHLPNSIHVPWEMVLTDDHTFKSPQNLRAEFIALGAQMNQPIFTYCTGGVRSAFVYLALREAGFKLAMNYDGSWWDWTAKHTQIEINADH